MSCALHPASVIDRPGEGETDGNPKLAESASDEQLMIHLMLVRHRVGGSLNLLFSECRRLV